MKRSLIIGGLVLAALVLGAVTQGERLLIESRARQVEQRSLEDIQALLAPALTFYEPADVRPQTGNQRVMESNDWSGTPLPTLIMFHGCAGYRPDFMASWAKTANDAGYLAVGVDSHTPRGIDYEKSLATVCTGQQLIGMERVADLRAAIDLIARDPRVDPTRIVLAGWSHGAWTLMDHFAMEEMGRTPPTLKNDPEADAIAGTVIGEIFFYPYCGPGALTRLKRWSDAPPAIAFVAGDDQIVDGPQCKRLFDQLITDGAPIDFHYYPDVDHVFDDPTQPPEFAHFYNAPAEADARSKVSAFLTARAR